MPLIHGWQSTRDDSLVYFESLEDSKSRDMGQTEEPDGSDVLWIEGPVPPPSRIVGTGVRGTGTRAGRGRGRSHDSSLRKAPFISTLNGEPRSPPLAPILLARLIQHWSHSLGRHAVRFSPSTYSFWRFSRLARVGEKFHAISALITFRKTPDENSFT